MPVIIDGNNLLFAAQATEDPARPIGRSMLCDALGAWARRRGEHVHVVFDGPSPAKDLASQISHAAIDVTYSGKRSADDALIEMLEQDSAARRLVVVSSDRAIIRVAKRRRATPVGSEQFWAALQGDLARPEPRPTEPEEKRSGLSGEATESWLREFGFE